MRHALLPLLITITMAAAACGDDDTRPTLTSTTTVAVDADADATGDEPAADDATDQPGVEGSSVSATTQVDATTTTVERLDANDPSYPMTPPPTAVTYPEP